MTQLFVTAPAQARYARPDPPRRAGAGRRRARGQRRGHGRAGADRHPAGHPRRLPVRGCAAGRRRSAARPRLVVVLANVRDPGNAGTVLRTADAAGADGVIFAGSSVDPYNSKCVRASAGSLFHLPVVTGRAGAGDGGRRCARPACGCWPRTAAPARTLDDLQAAGLLGQPDRVAVRQRGLGPARRPPGPGRRGRSRCPSTAGRRA